MSACFIDCIGLFEWNLSIHNDYGVGCFERQTPIILAESAGIHRSLGSDMIRA